jgi:hypothetical protein
MVVDNTTKNAVPAEVIRHARKSDSEALNELYRRFSRRVLGLCLHLLGRREDAEDATSEVFMKLGTALGRYDDAWPFRPWLTGVAASTASTGCAGGGGSSASSRPSATSPPRSSNRLLAARRPAGGRGVRRFCGGHRGAAGVIARFVRALLLRRAELRRDRGAAGLDLLACGSQLVSGQAEFVLGTQSRGDGSMTCPSGEIWTAYADDEPPRAELQELEAHLAGCADCRSLVLALREENRLLARVLDEIPDAGKQRSVGLPGVTVGVGTLVAIAAGLQVASGWLAGLGREAPAGLVDERTIVLGLLFETVFYLLREGASMLDRLSRRSSSPA